MRLQAGNISLRTIGNLRRRHNRRERGIRLCMTTTRRTRILAPGKREPGAISPYADSDGSLPTLGWTFGPDFLSRDRHPDRPRISGRRLIFGENGRVCCQARNRAACYSLIRLRWMSMVSIISQTIAFDLASVFTWMACVPGSRLARH